MTSLARMYEHLENLTEARYGDMPIISYNDGEGFDIDVDLPYLVVVEWADGPEIAPCADLGEAAGTVLHYQTFDTNTPPLARAVAVWNLDTGEEVAL